MCYGALDQYVDLGQFCDAAALKCKSSEILRLNREYKGLYSQAYACIRAACEIGSAGTETGDADAAKELARSFADNALPKLSQTPGRIYKRFCSAFTHKGYIDHTRQNCAGMALSMAIEKDADFSAFADELCRLAAERGYDCILSKDALIPRQNAALILPQTGVIFTADSTDSRLDKLDRAIYRAALAAARKRLAAAKALHDELEAIYIPTIDFTSLTAFAQQHIRRLKDAYTHRNITF